MQYGSKCEEAASWASRQPLVYTRLCVSRNERAGFYRKHSALGLHPSADLSRNAWLTHDSFMQG